MNEDEAIAHLSKVCLAQKEHFDAIQMFVTWQHNGETYGVCVGDGNWHARVGMSHDFLDRVKARIISEKLAEKLNPPDEDDFWKK